MPCPPGQHCDRTAPYRLRRRQDQDRSAGRMGARARRAGPAARLITQPGRLPSPSGPYTSIRIGARAADSGQTPASNNIAGTYCAPGEAQSWLSLYTRAEGASASANSPPPAPSTPPASTDGAGACPSPTPTPSPCMLAATPRGRGGDVGVAGRRPLNRAGHAGRRRRNNGSGGGSSSSTAPPAV